MRQQEVRRLIIGEWDRWVQSQLIHSGTATARDSLKFFLELQDTRSALLNFSIKRPGQMATRPRMVAERASCVGLRGFTPWAPVSRGRQKWASSPIENPSPARKMMTRCQ